VNDSEGMFLVGVCAGELIRGKPQNSCSEPL